MKVLIPFEFWRAANLAKAKKDVRYYLNAVHIGNGRIEGSNGHVAYVADFTNMEMPELSESITNDHSVDLIIEPKNKIPTSTKARNIQYVRIITRESDAVIEYINDYDQVVAMDIALLIDAKYPNIKRLEDALYKQDVVQGGIGVRTEYLELVRKISGKGLHHVEMQTRGPESAILFKFKKIDLIDMTEILLVMPCSLDR